MIKEEAVPPKSGDSFLFFVDVQSPAVLSDGTAAVR